PAAFLLTGDVLDSAERSLFAAGFETIVLRANLLDRESFHKVFDLLYSAGFVVLIAADELNAEILDELEEYGDRIVFDLTSNYEQASGGELISRILNRAHSLRLGAAGEKGE
ncbi:MAG: hypothetical protein JO260_06685, partial [Acidobacteria bacterium]|nr:hypothetical protein [Acidobacteriota bacterium]